MAEIGFYHLQGSRLEQALPRLLQKIISLGHRIVLLAGSPDRLKALNEQLWTYGRGSFLPHGAAGDGRAEEQPIYLTAEVENLNGATVLVLVDGADPADKSAFDRCLDMFDGNDPPAVAAARGRWQACKDQGFDVTYWQQGPRGWEKKA